MSTQRYQPQTDTVPRPLTYAEVRGKEPFDWNLFLRRAEAGQVTETEALKAYSRSVDWVTCACGNTCAVIQRSQWGQPIDMPIRQLGYVFTHNIRARDWANASQTLSQIEARAVVLISQLS